jgi:fructokinase
MSRADVVVFGEALVDCFEGAEVIGGAPFNVARTLAALGEWPLMVTRVGDDARGARIRQELARLGMRGDGVQCDPARPTGVVRVAVRQGQPQFAIEANAAWDHLSTAEAEHATRDARPRLVYFGTLAQRAPASHAALRAVLSATTAQRVLDLNLRGQPGERDLAEQSLALADIVKVNDDELATLHGWFGDSSLDEAGACRYLLERFDLRRLVVTRGAAGWSCLSRDGEPIEGAAPAVNVVDTVGAGDAFTAVMLLGALRGWPIATTLDRAAQLAASVCTLQGAFDGASPIYARARVAWA